MNILIATVILLLQFGGGAALASEPSTEVADGSARLESVERELDAYWMQVAAYLANGDYDGLVSTYHPDAVLVSEHLDTSYPITRALARWKPGILATAAGEAMSFVEFRITRRLFSENTSHERGIFHFRSGPLGDNASEADFAEDYIHFEGLLVKDGRWLMVMEYQKQPATKAEWDAAAIADPRATAAATPD